MAQYNPIETKYGHATLCPTDANHVYFDANHNSGSDMNVGLTVRGVRYGVSAHLHRWSDGSFRIGVDGKGGIYAVELYVTRAGSWGNTVSEPARKSILEEVEKVVNAWAAANPARLDSAELASVERELDDKYEALKEAKDVVDKLLLDIAELLGKRHEAQQAVNA